LVSEFAARCPACHHGIEDAEEIPDPSVTDPSVTEQPDEPPSFLSVPVRNDPQDTDGQRIGAPGRPTAHSRRRIGPVAMLATAAGIVAALTVTFLSSSGGRGAVSAPLKTLAGRVLAVSPRGTLVSVDPVSGQVQKLAVPVSGTPFVPASVSPDGQQLLDEAGNVFAVTADGSVARSSAVSRILDGSTSPARSMPFADDNQAVLALTRPAGGPTGAILVSLADGHEFDLGEVDSAGGDALSLGAFVSVPYGAGPADLTYSAGDMAVDLRTVGDPSRLLSTAPELNEDVGASPTRPVRLGVYPNPTGDAVAVVLTPLDFSAGNVSMVVLNRQGNLLGIFPKRLGPIYGSQVVWSPGGHQLAYPTDTSTGPALAVGTETGAVYTVVPPAPDTTFDACIWSPSSMDVLCQTQAAHRHDQWLYATETTEKLVPARSAGYPVAWISALL
jgi:hypothetical protein